MGKALILTVKAHVGRVAPPAGQQETKTSMHSAPGSSDKPVLAYFPAVSEAKYSISKSGILRILEF